LTVPCTRAKLSWIHLFLMKDVWFEETKFLSSRASLFARSLVTILEKLCTRLIGMKSPTLYGFSFLGMNTMKARFSNFRPY
jgi:xanthine/uracil permease